jgi:hypothetical protein
LQPEIPKNIKDFLLSKFDLFNFHMPSVLINAPYEDQTGNKVNDKYEEYGIETSSILVYMYADIVLMLIAEIVLVIIYFVFWDYLNKI